MLLGPIGIERGNEKLPPEPADFLNDANRLIKVLGRVGSESGSDCCHHHTRLLPSAI
jgi:hypothetical protein